MTNPMFNPQPNYSGVTIQITNPAVYTGQFDGRNIPPCVNGGYCGVNNGLPNTQGNYINYPQASYSSYTDNSTAPDNRINHAKQNPNQQNVANPTQNTGYQNAYPAQYYLNNYNYNNGQTNKPEESDSANVKIIRDSAEKQVDVSNSANENYNGTNAYQIYANNPNAKNNDLTKSQNIIGDISEREAEIQEEKKNTKETKIVALTDEYIKSLENYLNNPNDEIRLMASKEILTRLDEDKDRYDDAALNALLNKMLQDPNKLVRIAALSAFSSQLASGNDYTVKLLHNIQSNPNADKEDVLQAADILLKMSAGVEIKNIPNPSVKEQK